MVLCRGFDAHAGWLVFYTDRESAKGRALAKTPRAALVFHWDALERQARIEGPVTLAPDADSDAYWLSRPPDARIAAAASEQSRPIASRAAFLQKIEETAARFAGDAPRPPRWGGYRVWAERVELWVGQPARAHDRAAWTRALARAGAGPRRGSSPDGVVQSYTRGGPHAERRISRAVRRGLERARRGRTHDVHGGGLRLRDHRRPGGVRQALRGARARARSVRARVQVVPGRPLRRRAPLRRGRPGLL